MDKNIIVMISEDHLGDLASIADKLRRKGLAITGQHDYGVISGTISSSIEAILERIEGVEKVMPDLEASISPPGEPPE